MIKHYWGESNQETKCHRCDLDFMHVITFMGEKEFFVLKDKDLDTMDEFINENYPCLSDEEMLIKQVLE